MGSLTCVQWCVRQMVDAMARGDMKTANHYKELIAHWFRLERE